MTNLESMSNHVSNDVLVKLLDDELALPEAKMAEAHLETCSACRDRHSELRRVSASFDGFLDSLQLEYSASERNTLAHKLEAREQSMAPARRTDSFRRMGWSLALAASVAVGIFLYPFSRTEHSIQGKSTSLAQGSNAFEIDGETFVALPYSNPELPVNSSHIVQMQVPVSSLADAGILLEPIGSRVAAPDGAVLADVLLGLDGQPLGVHVVN